ncbi:aspartic proteinase nepenthesin-1 [Lolium perenne]|uniref:aspartic proteinase nepenthesin-1 n=1 Tax=Lolium perenne TaxID=4522 RepID=UPI0021F5775A|nr:aspartic proteinase nepenthesin-1-like [Lolium perenne]
MTKDMSALHLLPYVLVLTMSFAWPITESTTGRATIRADLTHVDSGRGFTKRELLRRMAARSRARLDSRWSPPGRGGNAHAVTVPVARGTTGKADYNSEYNIHFAIGTPTPQPVVATLDTGSDLIWTQCVCMSCFEQPFPVLDPSVSGTFRVMPCSDHLCEHGGLVVSGCNLKDKTCLYAYHYGDKSGTYGTMGQDTFTFKAPNGMAATVPNLRFGCAQINHLTFRTNETGIAGFGRGPLSLPSQLKVARFSHCFTTIVEGKPSPVFLGTPDNLQVQATGQIKATPFVPNPRSPLYFLSLKGITVGKTRLPFNASVFALKGDGSGGTITDSGTALTSFPEAVFQALRKAFALQVLLPVEEDNDMCFSTSPKEKLPAVPKLILHLEGTDWDLPRENYVLDIDHEDGTGGELCLMIVSSGEGSSMTTIGNFQQQNIHIVYDLEVNKMFFVPARCDKL